MSHDERLDTPSNVVADLAHAFERLAFRIVGCRDGVDVRVLRDWRNGDVFLKG